MAIEIIPAESLWRGRSGPRQAGHRQDRWPGRPGNNRLRPLTEPRISAGFQISRSDRIFCIGSCFAREIEVALERFGYEVLSTARDLPVSPRRQLSDGAMVRKFNVASIRNELAWALDPADPWQPESNLVPVGGGLVHDYQLCGAGYGELLEPAIAFRQACNQLFARIRQADVVVLTLGLSEVWFDRDSGLHLNVAVPAWVADRHPGRFELHVFDHGQTLAQLEACHRLLCQGLAAPVRLLVTVSPVPLARTFRDKDVFSANAYSKAVLRSAVEEFVAGRPGVDYFPSYEICTLSDPSLVWEPDHRHVQRPLVGHLMGQVLAAYTGQPEGAPLLGLDAAIVAWQADRAAAARVALQGAGDASRPGDPALAVALLKLGLAMQLRGGTRRGWLALVRACRRLQVGPRQMLRSRLLKRRRSVAGAGSARATGADAGGHGYLDAWDGRVAIGWALSRRGRPLTVVLEIEGQPQRRVLADKPRPDVADDYGRQHLRCGFQLELDASDVAPGTLLAVWIEDSGEMLVNSPLLAVALPGTSGHPD
jgi:hypothetical protein